VVVVEVECTSVVISGTSVVISTDEESTVATGVSVLISGTSEETIVTAGTSMDEYIEYVSTVWL
jgi:hypothetical protein